MGDKDAKQQTKKGMLVNAASTPSTKSRASYTDVSRSRVAIEGNKGMGDTERVTMVNHENGTYSDSDSMDVATTNIAIPAHMATTMGHGDELEYAFANSMEARKGSTKRILLPIDVSYGKLRNQRLHDLDCHTSEITHCSSGLPGNCRTSITETYVGDHEMMVLDNKQR